MKNAIFQSLELFALCLLAVTAEGRSPHRESITFQSVSNTGLGRSLYVVGGHPDVGDWDPAKAHRLSFQPGNVWSGRVAVQSGTALAYKFISRSESSATHCDTNNVHWMPGADVQTNVLAQPDAPYVGKTVFYHSGWTSASLIVVQGTNGSTVPLERVGAGRGPGEFLYRGTGIGEAGEPLQFVPSGWLNGTQYYDNVQGSSYGAGDYYTRLDTFFVQDGQVYNYWPPAAPSPSTIVTTFVNSGWAAQIPSRNVRIYLPRGYTNNTWKRYPVLYLHDGQNVFRPGGGFGCWFAEDSASREMGQGRAREAILVGVDNGANRCGEYLPAGDSINDANCGGLAIGLGNYYANFLIHNVRPTLDNHYRTLNDRPNTLTLGSSLGGLISTYLGLSTNVFGGVGPMSPAYWAAPVFRGWIASNATLGLRVYTDLGSDEGSSMWDYFWPVRDELMRDGYTENKDLKTVVGCGQIHNEAAWSNRFPLALRFLLDPWDEPNLLARQLYPSVIKGIALTASGAITGTVDTLVGHTYVLQRSSDMTNPASWSGISTVAVESLPWAIRSFSATNSPDPSPGTFFRAIAQ
jgi:predicted alpha/beta superfamily hydrolase